MIRERVRNGIPGLVVLLATLVVWALVGWLFVSFVQSVDVNEPRPILMVLVLLLSISNVLLWRGLFMVAPNEGRVLQLFGDYAGTARQPGLRRANPFYTRK